MESQYGKIQIRENVISIIAYLAATEVEGVAKMHGEVMDVIVDFISGVNSAKGVKVEVGEVEVAVDLSVSIKFGYKIPEVCKHIQENVMTQIESMTGLSVKEVNIKVLTIELPQPQPEIIEEKYVEPRVK